MACGCTYITKQSTLMSVILCVLNTCSNSTSTPSCHPSHPSLFSLSLSLLTMLSNKERDIGIKTLSLFPQQHTCTNTLHQINQPAYSSSDSSMERLAFTFQSLHRPSKTK
ncbi:hypothetical protein M758_3G222200 [Ceratodon purpureus]|uniref:Uncharacterized protein n=1 Tax=Ceratodon purpureus TaxID=3225 RepID=A0A8T0ILE4_CERPU|nr:hypothetical protein KC19_3G220500 [Ceratodon purpureus]KAG0624074.1 hypothetical protein M758_3G222200 [Ceratodon purpureus]